MECVVDVERLVHSGENATAQNSSPSSEFFCEKIWWGSLKERKSSVTYFEACILMAGNKTELPTRPRKPDAGSGTSSPWLLNIHAASGSAKEAPEQSILGHGRRRETAPTISKHFP